MNETFNIKEASIYLKSSISSLRKMVRNKSIPFYRIGNKLFFRKEAIDLWIYNQEQKNLNVDTYETKIKKL